MSEFYVGYLPKAPKDLSRTLLRTVIALACLAIALALLLVFNQHPFANSRFAFRDYHDYSGIIVTTPYPVLLTREARFLLVAPGKHSAVPLLPGFHLHAATLKGALIQHGQDQMLEVLPGSIHSTAGDLASTREESLGSVTLVGEIVDTKCYLGVMNPGNGKVHRDCAARCISGGIPPALRFTDAAGEVGIILLAGSDGRAISREVLDYVAEPVQITGRLVRSNGSLILQAEPTTYRRMSGRTE